MKISVAVISILVVLIFSSLTSSAPMGSNTPKACCFSHVRQQIPRKFVIDYYKTSSLCSQPAVVFLTKKGREMCANPSDDWVQKYIEDPELN